MNRLKKMTAMRRRPEWLAAAMSGRMSGLTMTATRTLVVALLAVVTIVTSCQKEENTSTNPQDHQYDRVMIYYGCGQNNLDVSMKADIIEMTESEGAFVPSITDDKAIVVCYHGCRSSSSYAQSGTTYTIWIYRDHESGSIRRDTLARDEYTTTADHIVMNELLGVVKRNFKSNHYGIVFSSHGTGWMPQGSYNEEEPEDPWVWDVMRQPRTSFGQERVGNTDYFMDIPEMAVSFPMKMDYIIFDACLMGCVEVAYQLAGATDVIGFSQAEVMSDGFYYPTMTQRLLVDNDPQKVVEETYKYYSDKSSTSVVSFVDCRRMEPLAKCCRELIAKYRSAIAALTEDDVQGFYTGNHPWFFDLKDIFVQADASDEDLDALQQAMNQCVLYHDATPHIRHMVTVRTSCGFSMYMPQMGTERLNNYYRDLAWNVATGFVE